jgi:hypothetical protein
MKKIVVLSLALSSLLFVNCKKNETVKDFKSVTENYFKEKNELNPSYQRTWHGDTEQGGSSHHPLSRLHLAGRFGFEGWSLRRRI